MRTTNRAGVQARAKQAVGAALFAGVAGLALTPQAASAQPRAEQDGGLDRGRPCAENERRPDERREGDRCFMDDRRGGPGGERRETTTVEEVISTGVNTGPDSLKYVAPPLDTPQTVTVVPRAVIEAQNLLSLRDILSTVPGITFGAGEGGGGYGDSINLRGYTATSDVTVDGVRDSAQYSRTDTFNLEQLEVTNGANGAVSGSGSVGGSINQVSKSPGLRDTTTVTVGGGTDAYVRFAVDANRRLGETVAVRLNAMMHNNDVPGRDVENFERWGIAPSLAIGLGTDTRATFSFLHQEDDNTPQYGIPFYNGHGVEGIPTNRYYGFSNFDKQESENTAYSVRLDHDFSPNLRLSNLTRYATVDQTTRVTPPQGVFCLANGTKPAAISATNSTGYTACLSTDPLPGFARLSGPRGTTRISENTTFHNQTDLSAVLNLGSVEHRLTAGASITSETYQLDSGNSQRTAIGGAVTIPDINIADPDNTYTGPINYIRSSIAYGDRDAQALYLFDAMTITPKFEINGGIRYDHSKGVNSTDSYATSPPTAPATTPLLGALTTSGAKNRAEDDLFSYRFGGVFKPIPNASIYFAYGNSMTPSQSAVNGSCAANTCNVKPEEAATYEIGAKWDLPTGLSLTGSIFRNGRTNYRVALNDPAEPSTTQVTDGESRVDGITLGASGKITDDWAIFANYTFMDSEVVQSVSDFCVANPGVGSCPATDPLAGLPLTSVPDHAFSLYSTYQVRDNVQVGYGLTYQGEYFLNQSTTLPVKTDDYFVSRLVVTWAVNRATEVRFNINNLFDEEYYQRGRNNGWATPGDARNMTVTLNRRF